MSVSFDYYKIFYYVAKYRNITTAAKALFLSQPTVSKYIQSLEEALGCALFVRSKKGVSLTPEAELLYPHIAQACELILQAEEELFSRQSLQSGVIRIGASEMTLHNYLLPVLETFRAQHPQIKIKIYNYSTPDALAALQNGLIDFAVVVSPIDVSGLSATPLAHFQDVAIAGRAYFSLKGRRMQLAEITQYPLICMEPGTISRKHLEQFFFDHGVELHPDVELATTDLITPMVAHNLGIGFVPMNFAQKALAEGTVIRLDIVEKIPARSICLVRCPAPLSIAGQAFTAMLTDRART